MKKGKTDAQKYADFIAKSFGLIFIIVTIIMVIQLLLRLIGITVHWIE
jgi:hypothetical protein